MSDEFAKTYLFLDNLQKNADLQRKQQEIERLRTEANRRATASTPDDYSKAGMIDRASYNLLQEKLAYYERLLDEPLAAIAVDHPGFKEKYDAERLLLAEWMVSQKGFQEVAIKYGLMAGKTVGEIKKEGLATQLTIVNGESAYGNHVNLPDEFRDKLREKVKHKG